jgi:hypothetical protein
MAMKVRRIVTGHNAVGKDRRTDHRSSADRRGYLG